MELPTPQESTCRPTTFTQTAILSRDNQTYSSNRRSSRRISFGHLDGHFVYDFERQQAKWQRRNGDPDRNDAEREAPPPPDSGWGHLAALPPEVATSVCSYLSLSDVGALVLRTRRDAFGSAEAWRVACTQEWTHRVYVPAADRALFAGGWPAAALKSSVLDSVRSEITDEEICAFEWSFRFKRAAGSTWTDADPYWTRGEPMTYKFEPGGRLLRTDAPLPLRDDRGYKTWRIVERPAGFPPRRRGGYVRVSVGGSEVPTYVVRRSPMGDWGFVMVSCWGVFSSHKMLPPGAAGGAMDDRRLALRGRAHRLEVDLYNAGARVLP